jgi:crotonobetainyl-CoA:carnitine CoA-transferase CaiB-like acyl-CoA transferase
MLWRSTPCAPAHWKDAINAAGGACIVCKTVDEWLVHPHAIAAGMVAEVDDVRYGRMKQPGVQVTLRRTPGRIQGRVPLLGEHTRSVLDTLSTASAPASVTPTHSTASPLLNALAGVCVLDLCIILAGPTCGKTLAAFDADDIKIDDPIRPGDAVGYMDVNRGKRSIELNLKTEAGRAIFWRLFDTAARAYSISGWRGTCICSGPCAGGKGRKLPVDRSPTRRPNSGPSTGTSSAVGRLTVRS